MCVCSESSVINLILTKKHVLLYYKYSSLLGPFVTYEKIECCEYGSIYLLQNLLVSSFNSKPNKIYQNAIQLLIILAIGDQALGIFKKSLQTVRWNIAKSFGLFLS